MRPHVSESRSHPAGDHLSREVESALQLDGGVLAEDDDLFELGLDSLTVIRLVAEWRHRGLDVTLEELVDGPTLRQWRVVLTRAASKLRQRSGGHH
ncbi:MAG: phosphopantetheine-binding protein [Pseudonocardiaceae bacterium]